MTLPLVLLLAAAGMTLPDARARRRALVGPLLAALAFASLAVARGDGRASTTLPVSYAAVTAALLLIAVALPLALAALALRDPAWQGSARLAGLTTALAGLGLGLRAALPLASHGGRTTLTAAASLLAIAGLLRYTGPRVAAGLRWADALAFPVRAPAPGSWDTGTRRLLAVSTASAALACVVSRLDLLLLAVTIGVGSGLAMEWRLCRPARWPVAVPLAIAFLGVTAYLMIHVAGDTPLTLRALRDGPYSPAFETLAVLLLGLVSWILLGLFPFAAALRNPSSALLAGVLLVRLAAPLLPYGWVHWQPIFFLIPAVAAWHAAATRRDEEALVALGALGLLSESPLAGWCGIAIAGGSLLLRGLHWLEAAGRHPDPRGDLLLRLTPIAAAPLLLPLLHGALEAQIFYTVVTVLGVAGALFGTRAPTPR